MSRIILHCGLHKSGSTSLQTMLRDSEAMLRDHAVLYPRAGRMDMLGGGHHNIAWQIGRDRRFRQDHGTLDDLMQEIAGFDGDIVLSSEDFENSLRHVGHFARLLGHRALAGRRPVFVIYLRDQASYLESLYQQHILQGFGEDFEQFLGDAIRHGHVVRNEWDYQFDYRRILENLQSVPGVQAIIRIYSTNRMIADFFSLLDPALVDALPASEPRANSRMLPVELLRKFYRNRFDNDLGRWHIQAINRLCNLIKPRGLQLLPTTRQALADAFQADNAKLCAQLGLDQTALDLHSTGAAPDGGAVSMERFFSFETQLAISEIASLLDRLAQATDTEQPVLTRQMYRLVHSTRRGWLLAPQDQPATGAEAVPSPDSPPPDSVLPPDLLLGYFESLGDNCEFGIVQRNAGIEPLGLFRFAFSGLDALIRALNSDFADIGAPEQLEIYVEPNDEAMVRLNGYGFSYHTHTKMSDTSHAALVAQQVRVVGFLVRKLRGDLTSAEKIFIRKGADSLHLRQITPLLAALRRYGPVTLLWVVTQDDDHPPGTVEVLEHGFLKGYVNRFAPYDDAYDVGEGWHEICRAALQLWQQRKPPGSVVRGAQTPGADNLIRSSDNFEGAAWRSLALASAVPAQAPPSLFDGCTVLAHRLTKATTSTTGVIHRHSVGQGLTEGKVYVASMFVWIPADFNGELVGAVFDGFASLRMQNANLSFRQRWQRVWVTALIPTGVAGATPSLYVVGPQGSEIFSTCWKLETGQQPTQYRTGTPQLQPSFPLLTTPAVIVPPPINKGHVIKTIKSPAFSIKPPLIYNEHLIPPDVLAKMRRMWDRGEFQARDIVIRVLENVIVADDGLIFTDAYELVKGSELHHEAARIAGARAAIGNMRNAGTLALQAGTYVMCKKRGVANYGHWLMDMFPIAVLTQENVADPTLRYIVPKAEPPLASAIDVAMLGIGLHGNRLLHADAAPRRLERLIIVEGLTAHSTYMSPLAVEAVNTLAVDIPAGKHERLYVMRERGENRDFTDPDAVAALAMSRDHAPFFPGGAGLYAQIAAFAGARRMVGIMGAGMTNIVFAPRGAEVCNLAPSGMPDVFFWFIAGLRGLRYTEVRCNSQDMPRQARHPDPAVIFPETLSDFIFPLPH